MKRLVKLGCAAAGLALAAAAGAGLAAAETIGGPTGVVGAGHYAVEAGTTRLPVTVQGNDYVASGYGLKVQGSLRPALDLYLVGGSQRLIVPASSDHPELRGTSGLLVGGGLKLELPAVQYLGLTSFLDLGARGFKSAGSMPISVTPPGGGAPLVMDEQNSYQWMDYRAAYGLRSEHQLICPYAGVATSWIDLKVTRSQTGGGSIINDTGSAVEGPIYSGFAGVELRVTPAISLTAEAITEGSSGTGFSIMLGEISRPGE